MLWRFPLKKTIRLCTSPVARACGHLAVLLEGPGLGLGLQGAAASFEQAHGPSSRLETVWVGRRHGTSTRPSSSSSSLSSHHDGAMTTARRPVRTTRGVRTAELVGEDALNDQEFWNHETWKDSDSDSGYSTESGAGPALPENPPPSCPTDWHARFVWGGGGVTTRPCRPAEKPDLFDSDFNDSESEDEKNSGDEEAKIRRCAAVLTRQADTCQQHGKKGRGFGTKHAKSGSVWGILPLSPWQSDALHARWNVSCGADERKLQRHRSEKRSLSTQSQCSGKRLGPTSTMIVPMLESPQRCGCLVAACAKGTGPRRTRSVENENMWRDCTPWGKSRHEIEALRPVLERKERVRAREYGLA